MRNGLSCSEAGKLGWLASQKTQQKKKEERVNKYNLNPQRCNYCNKLLSYSEKRKKFCNQKCAAKFNNNDILHRGKIKNKKHCKYCNKELKHYQKKYCSLKCKSDFYYEKYITEWLDGKHNGKKGDRGTSSYIRRYIKELSHNTCSICKNDTWMGQPIPLILDHINGNSDDNHKDNLRMVCGNCDMKLPTYKRKNKNSKRNWR